jgi:4a-hydroxytetrahydrobiopterin dehydratase
MAAIKLNKEQINQSLIQLNNSLDKTNQWKIKDNYLTKIFEFKSFVGAFGWMTQVGMVAEKMNHHPEWLNIYNKVEVNLTTHDVDGISDNDFKLAQKMQNFL